jgi:hypothetical protein
VHTRESHRATPLNQPLLSLALAHTRTRHPPNTLNPQLYLRYKIDPSNPMSSSRMQLKFRLTVGSDNSQLKLQRSGITDAQMTDTFRSTFTVRSPYSPLLSLSLRSLLSNVRTSHPMSASPHFACYNSPSLVCIDALLFLQPLSFPLSASLHSRARTLLNPPPLCNSCEVLSSR